MANHVYLTLSPTDYDIRQFLSYFVTAVQSIFSDFGKKIQVMLNAPDLQPMPIVTDSLFNELHQADRVFLQMLEKTNLFVIRLDEDSQWFRYHHLIQSLLKRRLKRRFNLDELRVQGRLDESWSDRLGGMSITGAFTAGKAPMTILVGHLI